MKFIDNFLEKWHQLWEKAEPAGVKIRHFFKEFKKAFLVVWNYLCRMQKVLLAIPVGIGAVYLAIYNGVNLPPVVGLNLQADGVFAIQVVRELAVFGPLALTAVCLLLMFASRRTLTPWLVSMFSLSVPLIILLTNVFPG